MKKDVVKFVKHVLKERNLKLKDVSDNELMQIMSLHNDFITRDEMNYALKALRKPKK